jgi:hypothetical protein
MADVSSPLAEELLEGVTDAMVEDAAKYREDFADSPSATEGTLEATNAPARWGDAISPAAYEFVVRWETGGKTYYERVIKGKPVWPGYSSGITIGCGFDLGHQTLPYFQSQWGTRLPASDFSRLAQTLGFKTVNPNRSAKVAKVQALVRSLSDITVSWPVAIEQFDNAKMPRLVAQLYGALDNLDKLHPHCRGALLSLVFNRGAPFGLPDDRYREMRAIKDAMREGTGTAFKRIPALLRSMRRIWGETSSLSERREGEAKLFEAGLNESGLFESIASLDGMEGSATEAVGGAQLKEDHEPVEDATTDDADPDETEAILEGAGLEATGLSPISVRWHRSDDEQPDYRHLDRRLASASAEIGPDILDLLIKANEFAPLAGKMVFAFRGAKLNGGPKRENVPSITITDQRPDHRNFRCIIGVYDPASRRLWACQASTVPNAAYVFKCYSDFQRGKPIADLTGNVLPTGCYTMTVGVHRRGKPGEIPSVLRLSTTSDGASKVVVMRSLDDVTYDRLDHFPIATPADNVHPGQMQTGFSSAGCLTMPGFYSQGRHTGIWSDFRAALGFDDSSIGKQFSMMLLTGLDAIAASDGGADGLVRLRHGSRGERVASLQRALGLTPDTSQMLGPVTRKAFIDRQQAKLGWSDGIYAPAMDGLLGFNIYAVA